MSFSGRTQNQCTDATSLPHCPRKNARSGPSLEYCKKSSLRSGHRMLPRWSGCCLKHSVVVQMKNVLYGASKIVCGLPQRKSLQALGYKYVLNSRVYAAHDPFSIVWRYRWVGIIHHVNMFRQNPFYQKTLKSFLNLSLRFVAWNYGPNFLLKCFLAFAARWVRNWFPIAGRSALADGNVALGF